MDTVLKRLTRRNFIRLSAVVGSAALLAACAPPSPPTPQVVTKEVIKEVPKEVIKEVTKVVEKEKIVQATPVMKEAVTIRVSYRLPDGPPLYERLFPKFMEANPTIKLVGEPISYGAYEEYFAKLASMMAADTLGDVVWVSAGSGPFLSQVAKGFFRPLEDLITKQSYDLKVWYPGAIEALKLEGKLYALPSDMHPGEQFVYYNKKMFDAASVKYPAAGWSYDDLVAAADKLTKRSGDRTEVFGYAPRVFSWAQEIVARSNGGSYISADGKKSAVKEDPARTTLQWYYDIMYKQKVATRKQDVAKDVTEMFYAEQAAMTTNLLGLIFSGPARIGDKFKFGAVRMPKGKAGKQGGMVHIGGQAIYTKTKYPDESFKALAFITGLDNALIRAIEYGGTLARRDLFEHAKLLERGGDMWKTVLEAMADPDLKPYFTPYNFRTSEMQSVIDQTTDAFWTGNSTVAEGIDQLDSSINIVLAKPR